jgi:hypothetical protein
MGSGSSGGGGGGGTGGSTSGGGGGYGGYQFRAGTLVTSGASPKNRAKALSMVLKKLSPEYIHEQFVTSGVREIHHELILVSVDLRANRRWDQIAARLGVNDGPGCLLRLAAELTRRHEAKNKNEKSRSSVRMALENLLIRMVGDDTDVFLSGSAADVLAHLQPDVFDQLANEFLGDLLYEVIRTEERALPPEVKGDLRDDAQDRARRIADNFVHEFGGRALGPEVAQASYNNLFDGIALKEDWFLSQLRK